MTPFRLIAHGVLAIEVLQTRNDMQDELYSALLKVVVTVRTFSNLLVRFH